MNTSCTGVETVRSCACKSEWVCSWFMGLYQNMMSEFNMMRNRGKSFSCACHRSQEDFLQQAERISLKKYISTLSNFSNKTLAQLYLELFASFFVFKLASDQDF